MKKILGLDLGTNSIGWAVVNNDFDKKEGKIIGAGSRIIPMSQDILGKFESGQSISQTAERTGYRGTRRLYQRENLRRERLHRVLNILNFLPEHYKNEIDFEKKLGQFKSEVKINYRRNAQGKYEFIFMDAFNEMVKEFKNTHLELFYTKKNGEKSKIPYDWTIYYLRKKALKEKISKEELAWILLNFNQKRGYYQLRGDELVKDNNNKKEEYKLLTVKAVKATNEKNAKGTWYEISFEETEAVYRRQSKESLDNWTGLKKEFIITTSKNKDGSIKYSFRAPKEDDWGLVKKRTEQELENYINDDYTNKSVGSFIYDVLLSKPTQKIRGKLIKTIERKYYKKELEAIIKKQIEFHEEININTETGNELYQKSINELYKHNETHKNNISSKGFEYLFIEDIIFYQRPLKSQKSTIGRCQYEYRVYRETIKDSETGELKEVEIKQPLQAISKSHPLFQEFRLWQFIHNLRIHQREKVVNGKIKIDYDVTNELFKTEDDRVKLFDFLNDKKEIKQSQLIDFLVKEKYIEKSQKNNYRWNYVEDKTYPMSETHSGFVNRLTKISGLDVKEFLNNETERHLWHIIYSVKDPEEYKQALKKFARKHDLDEESFLKEFIKYPPFKSDYAAYSEKAIKKLLPLIRLGKYWDENKIPEEIKNRIFDIMERVNALNLPPNPTKKQINEAFEKHLVTDDDIQKQLVKSFIGLINKNPLKGLNTYQAVYAVYGRHSETSNITKWNTPEDIYEFLKNFKQHSLRNPIVEQVVLETLRTVRDIWTEYGDFDEIHLELGREMKNPAETRKKLTEKNIENEITNNRIRLILKELMNEGVPNVKDFSPSHQEILKIYEEGVYQNPGAYYDKLTEDEVQKIRKNPKPNRNDIIKYKLWLEQGYVSPYTGAIIPLTKLFSTEYQIEHIIPQSRYFDNSLSNKVICETEVNQDKGNKTAYEYIKEKGGSIIDGHKLFDLNEYEAHCKRYFAKNREKLKKLLLEEIPEDFIERQINDSRYISKYIKSLLSNIVRENQEQSETSKNMIPVTGAITSKLKQDWGLNDKWNEIILPRFERLNKLTNSNDFTYKNQNGKIIPTVPDELQRSFNKKRIDHRHHALDAIVIACTTRKHIQYLNSLNNEKIKYELQPSLLIKNKYGDFTKNFQLPWKTFPIDVKNSLENIIVSFKQNLRVINKATNYYQKWVKDENGHYKKKFVKQKGENWAIRKALHKETVFGKINIDDVPKGKIATAVRTSLSEIKNRKHLEKITDKGIVKILENHLKNYINEKGVEDFESAFSPEGIEELNKNIVKLNKGKKHLPIYKVRLYEVGNRFPLSENQNSNKSKKYVEAAKGTNLYFAIYETTDKKGNKHRSFETVPLKVVIEHQKQVAHLPKEERTPVPVDPSKGKLLFTLSPNDLVYVPTDEEMENIDAIDFSNLSLEQKRRIYKIVSFTNKRLYVVPYYVATPIFNKFEFTTLNKIELTHEKERCIKIKINRLGQITEVNIG